MFHSEFIARARVLLVILTVALAGCGGGRDDDPDARKDTPLPKCEAGACK